MGRFRDWMYPTSIHVSDPDGVVLDVDLSRFARHLAEAKTWLNTQIVADSSQFVPFRNGTLRSSVTFPDGVDGDVIEWNTPYAHYQYEGVVYVNPKYGASGFIGKDGLWHGWRGAKVTTARRLNYHTRGTGDHWIQRAKEAYGESWVRGVKRIAGGLFR